MHYRGGLLRERECIVQRLEMLLTEMLCGRGVCVCVCETFVPKRIVPYLFVIQHLKVQAFIPITAGGQCMPDSHCPTKTLSVHGDIWPDQPDVPATVCMEKRQVRFCKSNYLRRCNENCVLGRCPPHLSELRSAEP